MFAMESKVVVRFRGGRLIKGFTADFNPDQESFHVSDAENHGRPIEVSTSQLKAIFFVRTFEGDRNHPDAHESAEKYLRGQSGAKVKITFTDGEVMYGKTNGYSPDRMGFFLYPSDPDSNNDKIFVLSRSTDKVESWD